MASDQMAVGTAKLSPEQQQVSRRGLETPLKTETPAGGMWGQNQTQTRPAFSRSDIHTKDAAAMGRLPVPRPEP